MSRQPLSRPLKRSILQYLLDNDATPKEAVEQFNVSYDEVIDICSRHGYPDTEKMLWAIEHLQDAIDTPTAQIPAPPVEQWAKDRPAVAAVTPRVTPKAALPPDGDDEDLDDAAILLAEAEHSTRNRTLRCRQRALDELDKLRGYVIAERDEQRNRDEIARLEARLAELRGHTPPGRKRVSPSGGATEMNLECTLEHDEPRRFDTLQGFNGHRVHAHGLPSLSMQDAEEHRYE